LLTVSLASLGNYFEVDSVFQLVWWYWLQR